MQAFSAMAAPAVPTSSFLSCNENNHVMQVFRAASSYLQTSEEISGGFHVARKVTADHSKHLVMQKVRLADSQLSRLRLLSQIEKEQARPDRKDKGGEKNQMTGTQAGIRGLAAGREEKGGEGW